MDESNLTGASEALKSSFLVTTHGTADDPPIDLDRVELDSLEPVNWDGPSERVTAEDGIAIQTRRFAVLLGQDGGPGSRKESVRLRLDEQAVGEQVMSWEVIAPIAVTPKLLALVPGKLEHRLTLTSADGRPFRITRVETDVPGLEVNRPDAIAAVQAVAIRDARDDGASTERGTVTLHTDHPARPRVVVSVVIIR